MTLAFSLGAALTAVGLWWWLGTWAYALFRDAPADTGRMSIGFLLTLFGALMLWAAL